MNVVKSIVMNAERGWMVTMTEYIIKVGEEGYEKPTVIQELVRCKDCKHKPTGTNRDDLEFPDDKCPCQCEDYWYSWKPADDWYCENGEQKDEKDDNNN